MTETHHTFCRICEALCGLKVTVEDQTVVQIEPDAEHVATQGYSCLKGLKQHKLYDSPDRLLYPIKREGDEFSRVSWDDALQGIGQKVRQIRKEHGPNSVAMYVGTAAGFGVLHPVFAQGFMTGLGSTNMYASATQDCSNKFAVARQVYGFPFTQPFPDIDNTDCLIIVGANPAISKWSFLQVSNPIQRLKAITKRGAKLFFIDPRRTESAKVAGEHLFIYPNSDVFFYLSFLHTLIKEGYANPQRIEQYMTGYPEISALVESWSPERTAEITGISPQDLRRLVQAYGEAKGAALYCSTGVNMGKHGALAFWLQECINAVSGNLDKRGGTLVGRGVMDFPRFGKKHGVLMRDARSRVGDFPSVNDAFPGGLLADEILTPGKGQIRALFVTGGNPLLTMANAGRLREAFQDLELLVTLDILPTETGHLAHYQLPCTSPLQRPDLPFIFPLMLGLQSRPYLQATRAVLPAQGEQRDEASIYMDLARACGVSLFGSRIAQKLLEWSMKVHGPDQPGLPNAVPQEKLLNLLLRLTRQGSFRKLLQSPHGRPRPDHQEENFLGKRVLTEDGKLHLAPPTLLQHAQEHLESAFSAALQDKHRFKLITRRAITTHNSWTHNIEDFVGERRRTNYLYMNPQDAEALGLQDDELADVTSHTATVRVPIKRLDELMQGVVALPHGWGHQHAKGLRVASQTQGVNVNLLAADGPEQLDRLSGMAHLTGISVDIKPAQGPQAHTWSGLPESPETSKTPSSPSTP
ncbi:MAG: molybdopterin-dependent oxidoreductase [Myxococcales bacterium]|nr:molybdopterin-dependent oxidoreductase [Myxococcales bacterium]MCB9644017.1 molybdopterin-dependent oxidoreductase [Myxococcales bacterium]